MIKECINAVGLGHTRVTRAGAASMLVLVCLAATGVNAGELGGMYEMLSVRSAMDEAGYGRSVVSGHLHIDPDSGRFSIDGRSSDMTLSQLCRIPSRADFFHHGFGKKSACKRFFDRRTEGGFISRRGDYELLDNLTVRFKFDDASDFNPVEGLTNPDGSIVMLPIHPADGATLVVAVRASTTLSSDSVQGVYDWNARTADFPNDYSSRFGRWSSYESAIEGGEVEIAGSGYSSAGEGTTMKSVFSCAPAADGCQVSARLVARPSTTLPAGGELYVTPWGGIAIEGGDVLMPGLVSPDAQLIVAVDEESREKGRQGIVLMTRQGQGLSNTDVIGEYNAFALEDFFSTDGRVRNAVVEGSLSLDGETWFFDAGTDSSVIRDECGGSGETCFTSVTTFSAFGSAEGDYFVESNGAMTMNGIAIDGNPRFFSGNVSSDGNIIVLRRVQDNVECDFFCSGTQSVRSIIVAVRRDL